MGAAGGSRLGDGLASLVGFVACAAAVELPGWMVHVVKGSELSWLAIHWAGGLCAVGILVAAFLWIALWWNARLQRWAEGQDSFVVLLADVVALVVCLTLFQGQGHDAIAKVHALRGSDLAFGRTRQAFECWYGMWIVVMGYSGKIPWDVARQRMGR